MKRKLLCVALSLALVFTTVFAGAGSVYAATGVGTSVDTATQLVAEPLNTTTMLSSTTVAPEYNGWVMAPNTYVLTQLTPTESGLLYFDYQVAGTAGTYDDVGFYLLESCALTAEGLSYQYYKNYSWSGYVGDAKTYYKEIPVKKGTTYQFLFITDKYNDANVTVQARTRVYTTGQRDLAASTSQYTVVSGINENGEFGKDTWFKLKAAKTGAMVVDIKEFGSDSAYGKVRLYNSSKKALSETVTYSSSEKVYFGVKKGKTYYLKVSGFSGYSDGDYTYGVKYKINAATDRNLAKKAKAKKLVRKAKATQTLFVASTAKSTDWYKFYVSAKRKTQIKIDTSQMSSGELYVTVYRGTKKVGRMQTIDVTYNKGANYTLTYGKTYGKANKGTYHIKIQKSKNASGKYSVRYVK